MLEACGVAVEQKQTVLEMVKELKYLDPVLRTSGSHQKLLTAVPCQICLLERSLEKRLVLGRKNTWETGTVVFLVAVRVE